MLFLLVMSLIVITGPMKSGKSLELISRMSIYEHTNLNALLIQPSLNVRDSGIRSRLGPELPAMKVSSLEDINGEADEIDIIGVDEAFMFPLKDVQRIKQWLLSGKTVIASTLDISAMGNVLDFYVELLRLGVDELIMRKAVCELCKNVGAQFTVITKKGKPVRSGLPDLVPEDGTYEYKPACRDCFFS